LIEGPSGQRTLIRGVFGRGEGREPASDPSRRVSRAAGRAFLRWMRRATLRPVSPKTVVSGGRGACGRGVWWPSDLCNRVRSASTTSNRASPSALLRGNPRGVASGGVFSFEGRSLQPGCCEIRGRIGLLGQSSAAPSRSLVRERGYPDPFDPDTFCRRFVGEAGWRTQRSR